MKTFLSFFSILLAWHSFAQIPELMIQTGHGDKVEYVSFSADEAKMFSVDANNVGILWDVKEGRQLHIYKNAMAGEFNADNNLLKNFRNWATVLLHGVYYRHLAALQTQPIKT